MQLCRHPYKSEQAESVNQVCIYLLVPRPQPTHVCSEKGRKPEEKSKHQQARHRGGRANPPFQATTDLEGWLASNWPLGARKVWLCSPNGVGAVQCTGFSQSVSLSVCLGLSLHLTWYGETCSLMIHKLKQRLCTGDLSINQTTVLQSSSTLTG